MSLDTVLQIGKILRNSKNSLKYFNYVMPCPNQNDNWPLCITISINQDHSFNWEKTRITPENERNKLFYFKFKTSDSDSLVKYIFGDIYYEKKCTIKKDGSTDSSEKGYYRLANPLHLNPSYRLSSFYRGMNDYCDIVNSKKAHVIQQFHEELEKNIKYIERIIKYAPAISCFFSDTNNIKLIDFLENEENLYLTTIEQNYKNISNANLNKLISEDKSLAEEKKNEILFSVTNSSVFIHFDFFEKRHWYEFTEDLSLLKNKVFSEFIDNTPNGLVLKKTLYKTICSGDKKNDIQFPSFLEKNKYKSIRFQNSSLEDLFYAIEYTSKGIEIPGTNIKIIILPRGENLTVEDYEDFRKKKDESKIIRNNDRNNQSFADSLFDFSSSEERNITSFDVIFCKKGDSSPDLDLLELSGIEKSKIRRTKERIQQIASEIYQKRKEKLKIKKELKPLSIEYSFCSILGNPQTEKKTGEVSFKPNSKYQSHLVKVLPLIYLDNYIHDNIVLSAFIQNVEYSIRSGDEKYSFLKYNLEFLMAIQNSEINKFKVMIESSSYQIGLKLGKLAKPLKKKINSFEKRYVGLLTRHVSTKHDCIKFTNDINEMRVRHEKTWGSMSADVSNQIAELPISEYNKEELAFGFFEGYFTYEVTDDRKVFFTRLEKLLAEYENSPDLINEVEHISEALSELK